MEQTAFKAKLKEIVEKGFSAAMSEWYEGIEDISVLVGNPTAGIMAALTMPIFKPTQHPWDSGEILIALQQCAKTITEAVGLSV